MLEHLKSGLGPRLGHMSWPGAWAVITAIVYYSLGAEVLEKAWPLLFLNCRKH